MCWYVFRPNTMVSTPRSMSRAYAKNSSSTTNQSSSWLGPSKKPSSDIRFETITFRIPFSPTSGVDLAAVREKSRTAARHRGGLTAQRNQLTQPSIAQVEPQPNHNTNDDRQVEGLAHSQMSGRCSSQIAGQQDRAEKGSTRNRVEDCARQFHEGDAQQRALGITVMNKPLHGDGRLQQAEHSGKGKQQHWQGAKKKSRPKKKFFYVSLQCGD